MSKTSSPDKDNKTWPEEAKLLVGWNQDISETFHSRIYCVPETVVEAVSGVTETSLKPDQIPHHSARASDQSQDPTRNANVLTHLLTRWTLRPFPVKPGPAKDQKTHETNPAPAKEQTEVSVYIEYQFANPIYGAMSAAAAPKVAGYMIEAFEKRVKSLADEKGISTTEQRGDKGQGVGGTNQKVGASEGVLRPRGQSP